MIQIACLIGFVVLLGVFFAFQRTGRISVEKARELIRQGAKVIDVRGESEFRHQHLPGVVNIPGNHLRDEIARQAPDKNAVVLLHCLTGGRSGLATRTLRQMGYTQVFNLGGYDRAARILLAKS